VSERGRAVALPSCFPRHGADRLVVLVGTPSFLLHGGAQPSEFLSQLGKIEVALIPDLLEGLSWAWAFGPTAHVCPWTWYESLLTAVPLMMVGPVIWPTWTCVFASPLSSNCGRTSRTKGQGCEVPPNTALSLVPTTTSIQRARNNEE
jgi:hypothetical protein